MTTILTPTSIQGVEDLVKLLYKPGNAPDYVKQISDALLQLQRSDQGWQIADYLLHSGDQNVRFFGALTYTIKINQTPSLSKEQAEELLEKLLIWIKSLVSLDEKPLVIKKVCSTLATLYLRDDVPWTLSICHLMYCFCQPGNEVVAEQRASESWNDSVFPSSMNPVQIETTLEFAAILADEASKMDSTSSKPRNYHLRLRANLPHIHALLRHTIIMPSYEDSTLRCFTAWVKFAHVALEDWEEGLDMLRTLVSPALDCLRLYPDSISAVTLFAFIFDEFPSFIERKRDILVQISEVFRSENAKEVLVRLSEDDLEAIEFARLLISYASGRQSDLVKNSRDIAADELLELIHNLLTAPESEDYSALTSVVEFWIDLSEFSSVETDEASQTPLPDQLTAARCHVRRACLQSWQKSVYPPSQKLSEWTAEKLEAHSSFRDEVGDLLKSSNVLMPQWAFPHFTHMAVSALVDRKWAELEASLWALMCCDEERNIEHNDANDQALASIMGSALFSVIAETDAKETHGLRLKAVGLLARYSKFFDRRPEFLTGVFRFLFDCLEFPGEATSVTAHAILKLCGDCRKHLVPAINQFIEQYKRFLTWPTAEKPIKEKIIRAITMIVGETTPTYTGLDHLLHFVEDEIEYALHLCNTLAFEEGQDHAAAALCCLASIGKGLQMPEKDMTTPPQDAWTAGPVQQHICNNVARVFRSVPSGEIIEAACETFKSGFPELFGPFAFPPEYAIGFIVSANIHTPRLECILGMAHELFDTPKRLTNEHSARLLQHTAQLTQALRNPSEDPAIAQGLIDLNERIVRYVTGAFYQLVPTEALGIIFEFALRALRSMEFLPKKAAASFWVSFQPI